MNAPPEARRVVDFLRTKSGMKVRPGVLNGQRADYFKGSSAIKAVLSPEYAKLKNVPKVTSEEEAEKMLHNLLPFAFFLRVERGDKPSKKDERRPLQVNQMQMFEKDMYYAWFYEGQQLMMKLAGLGMVAVMLAAVMFPLWPRFMRVGVWYLSLGVLGLFGLLMVIAVLRLIFWLISIVVLPPGIWVFPNLFADVGVVRVYVSHPDRVVHPAVGVGRTAAQGEEGEEGQEDEAQRGRTCAGRCAGRRGGRRRGGCGGGRGARRARREARGRVHCRSQLAIVHASCATRAGGAPWRAPRSPVSSSPRGRRAPGRASRGAR